MITKNRIPHEFFETQGFGESEICTHAGSFHSALSRAGIANFNIIKYSSVIPASAKQISYEEFEKMDIPFGSEMFCIMSQCNASENELCTAGIVRAELFDNITDEKFGHLVCEIDGPFEEDVIKQRLERAINKLRNDTYSDYYLGDLHYIISSFSPQERFGTAISVLAFVSFKNEDF